MDGGIRKIQIQKQIHIETQKLIQIILFTWDGGTRRLSCTREFRVCKEDRVEETSFDGNEDKEIHFCKKATCEVRKSTLHLNLPTSLSSTEEISRNAFGGDDDRGRDHDVGDDDGGEVAHGCTRFPCYLGMEIYAINEETQ